MQPERAPEQEPRDASELDRLSTLASAWARGQTWKPGPDEVIFSGATRFQTVKITRIEEYGLNLYLDGQWQSGEADEFVYHEMLVHPALFCHPDPAHVLIIGGAEGATAREVLRHASVRTATQVDIDGELIEICKRYLPDMNGGSYDDPRLEIVIADGATYLEQTDRLFDIIILDLPDWAPKTPASSLYSLRFYRQVDRHLDKNGMAALHIGPFHPVRIHALLHTARMLQSVFESVLVYPAVERRWAFAVCSQMPLNNHAEREPRLLSPLRYYNSEIHAQLGALPNYVKSELARRSHEG